jgi:hypothetical protein
MRKRLGVGIVAALTALGLVSVSPAAAAIEVGSDCQATSGASGYTFVQLSRVSGGLPIAAPSAGVVTKWKVNSAVPTAVGQKLQILRPTGNPNEFKTVAESGPGTVSQGLNSFDARIPIQAGDRPAAADGAGGSVPAPLYCAGVAGDEMGALTPPSAVGSTNTYPAAGNLVAAISVVIEPDVDNDGFGDETQDKCPQSAAVQVECPVITLTTTGIARNGLAQILVGASSAASVSVSGTVNVPKKRKKAKAGKSAVISINGGTQLLAPGVIATFTLILPQRVKAALRALPRKRFLTLTATASATDVAGRPSSSTVKVKLRGTKPPPKGKAKGQK